MDESVGHYDRDLMIMFIAAAQPPPYDDAQWPDEQYAYQEEEDNDAA